MQSKTTIGYGAMAFCTALAAFALAACSKPDNDDDTAANSDTNTVAAANTAAPASSASSAPAADNTDTVSGVKFASYTGDAAKGATLVTICKTCHSFDKGANRIGPSLFGVVGREAGSIPDFQYSAANKNSGITWTPEKIFQYLEAPQRVVPGTKMTYPGMADPQSRADVIAYLKSNA